MERGNLEFRLDHTAIAVSDMVQSILWYNNFGYEVKNNFARPDLKVRGALLQHRDDNHQLELFEPYDPQPLEEYRKELATSLGHIGQQHLALRVPDLDKAYRYLQERGIEFAGKITVGATAKYVFCRDPDSMLVEIKQELA